jgi:hypothetical protein
MWKDRLKQEWNENPVKVITVVAFSASAAAKLMNAYSALKGRRAYAKQVNYRIKHG